MAAVAAQDQLGHTAVVVVAELVNKAAVTEVVATFVVAVRVLGALAFGPQVYWQ